MRLESNDTSDKKTREKSAPYPAADISECCKFIKQIDSLGRKEVPYASRLNLMGLTSPTTRSFLNRIGASKQFGFITTGGNTARLTDLARRILYPDAEESETQKLLIEAFGNPPLYAKLIERFKNKPVPSQVRLSNILMDEYRIIMQVKDNAAKCFLESADYLGLLDQGILRIGAEEEPPQKIICSQEGQSETLDFAGHIQQMDGSARRQETGYLFEIPTMGRKAARFYIPEDVTEKDIEYIRLYIEKMLPVFLDNLKTER